MPTYTKGRRGKFQTKAKWGGFHSPLHMTQWLLKTSFDDPIWQKFKEKALAHKNVKGKTFLHPRTIRAIATKHPIQLAKGVLTELKQHHKGEKIGGGLMEGITWVGNEVANVIGVNSFREHLGWGYIHRKIPSDAKIWAKAVDSTYLDKSKRPSKIATLKRLPEYDTERYSVWLEPNGQYLVTIHGTKINLGDLKQDAIIASGFKVDNTELQSLFERLDNLGIHYDIASHSLATQYVTNSTHKNADQIYMFNPASSPVMNADYLEKIANNPKYTYFINPSDPVSSALFSKMNKKKTDSSFIAPFTYSQVASHSLGQWFKDFPKEETYEPTDEVIQSKGEISDD